jgi:hypothetical protein
LPHCTPQDLPREALAQVLDDTLTACEVDDATTTKRVDTGGQRTTGGTFFKVGRVDGTERGVSEHGPGVGWGGGGGHRCRGAHQ